MHWEVQADIDGQADFPQSVVAWLLSSGQHGMSPAAAMPSMSAIPAIPAISMADTCGSDASAAAGGSTADAMAMASPIGMNANAATTMVARRPRRRSAVFTECRMPFPGSQEKAARAGPLVALVEGSPKSASA